MKVKESERDCCTNTAYKYTNPFERAMHAILTMLSKVRMTREMARPLKAIKIMIIHVLPSSHPVCASC